MAKKVLVIAPHPDDETLGCGGSLIKHKSNSDEIFWLIMTNVSENKGFSKKIVTDRQNEIDKVANLYGFKEVFNLNFPTTELDQISYGALVSNIRSVIQNICPNTIYLPNRSDVHTDHKITFNATISCCKDFRAPYIERILMYECLSETEFAPATSDSAFIPNVYIDITDFFDKKIEVFKVFSSEVMDAPLPRSFEAISSLAKFRGSRIGTKYAEAFSLIFEKNI